MTATTVNPIIGDDKIKIRINGMPTANISSINVKLSKDGATFLLLSWCSLAFSVYNDTRHNYKTAVK